MNKKARLLLLALALSTAWYFFVGVVDRQLAIHQYTALSSVCLHDYSPQGQVASPEGGPRSPTGSYGFLPLGIHCQFTMTDGDVVQSFHPRPALIWAVLPMGISVVWGVWILRLQTLPRGKSA